MPSWNIKLLPRPAEGDEPGTEKQKGVGLLALFGLTDSVLVNILAAPIAIQEMVFAVWIIAKDFKSTEKN